MDAALVSSAATSAAISPAIAITPRVEKPATFSAIKASRPHSLILSSSTSHPTVSNCNSNTNSSSNDRPSTSSSFFKGRRLFGRDSPLGFLFNKSQSFDTTTSTERAGESSRPSTSQSTFTTYSASSTQNSPTKKSRFFLSKVFSSSRQRSDTTASSEDDSTPATPVQSNTSILRTRGEDHAPDIFSAEPIEALLNEVGEDDPVISLLRGLERQNQKLAADPKNVQLYENSVLADATTMFSLTASPASSYGNTSPLVEMEVDPVKIGEYSQVKDCASSVVGAGGAGEDNDFWNSAIEDFPSFERKFKHLLLHKVRSGIPREFRGAFWQVCLSKLPEQQDYNYRKLITEKSIYSRMIQRDLARTYPRLRLFKETSGEGQRAMGRILRAYSVLDSEVGYCQGLGFLVGPLLMNMSEAQSFQIFACLMRSYNLRSLFLPSMQGLHARLEILDELVQTNLPEISAHLSLHNVSPVLFASQWFLTLFSYNFPLCFVFRVWDVALVEGWSETVLRIALALLHHDQKEILSCDNFEDLVRCLTRKLDTPEEMPALNEIIEEATSLWSKIVTTERMEQSLASFSSKAPTFTTDPSPPPNSHRNSALF